MQSYPIKIVRWLRHLSFELHAERRQFKEIVDGLAPRAAALAALLEP